MVISVEINMEIFAQDLRTDTNALLGSSVNVYLSILTNVCINWSECLGRLCVWMGAGHRALDEGQFRPIFFLQNQVQRCFL